MKISQILGLTEFLESKGYKVAVSANMGKMSIKAVKLGKMTL